MVTLFPTGTTLILVTLGLTLASFVPGDSGSTWASPVTGESGPHLGLTQSWWLFRHLDLIVVDRFLASPGSGECDPNLASSRSGDSGPHLWTIMIWILRSTPDPHLDMMTLDPLWASP